MKNAIGYARISTTDQSNFSISGQTEYIIKHCEKSNWNLLDIFLDEGQSAKNFDRANWKELEKYIRKNFKNVDYLIVSKYDRFSRNVGEALKMIDDLEKKYSIKVISVMEPISLHPDSPYYFQFRTQMLLGADVELRVIRDRTKFGLHSAAKSGRFIGTAPKGYKNARDEKNKPIIVIDEPKAKLIRKVFNLYLNGMPMAEIKAEMEDTELNLKGNSAVPRILRNQVYAGLIKVPKYYDEPERIIKGMHEGIISEDAFYTVQNMLSGRKQMHYKYNDDVPLRGILKCTCGRGLTAGKSKGKNAYYWYYYCKEHKKNFSQKVLHGQIMEILYQLKFDEEEINYIAERIRSKAKALFKNRQNIKASKTAELTKINEQIDSLELKYISNEIDLISYKKWHPKLIAQRASITAEINSLKVPYLERIDDILRKATDLCAFWEMANIFNKQALIKKIFGENLSYDNGIFRTPYISSVFIPKLLILKQKQLLEVQETAFVSGKIPIGSEDGS